MYIFPCLTELSLCIFHCFLKYMSVLISCKKRQKLNLKHCKWICNSLWELCKRSYYHDLASEKEGSYTSIFIQNKNNKTKKNKQIKTQENLVKFNLVLNIWNNFVLISSLSQNHSKFPGTYFRYLFSLKFLRVCLAFFKKHHSVHWTLEREILSKN